MKVEAELFRLGLKLLFTLRVAFLLSTIGLLGGLTLTPGRSIGVVVVVIMIPMGALVREEEEALSRILGGGGALDGGVLLGATQLMIPGLLGGVTTTAREQRTVFVKMMERTDAVNVVTQPPCSLPCRALIVLLAGLTRRSTYARQYKNFTRRAIRRQ